MTEVVVNQHSRVVKNTVVSLTYVLHNQRGEIFEYRRAATPEEIRNGRPASDQPTLQ